MLITAVIAANLRKPAPAIDRSKAAVDPVAAFKLRCEARAYLYSQGEHDLHDGVDALEESARLSGLNRTISRNGVQAIIAGAFRPVREQEWKEGAAAIETPSMSENASSATPVSTVNALLHVDLRCGLSCLSDSGARDRLRRCDEAAMRTIAEELLSWRDKRSSWLPPWSKEDVAKLLVIWRGLK
jgi:hypothetical protein